MMNRLKQLAASPRLSARRMGTVLAIAVIFSTVFAVTVVETGQVAVVTRTGSDQVRIIAEPGVYPRLPFVERVWLIDTRLQISEQREVQAFTAADQQVLQLAGWVAWRVADPALFSTASGSGKNPVDERILKAFMETLNGWLASHTAAVILKGQDADAMQRWLTDLNRRLAALGIQAESVGLRQVGLNNAATEAIYDRMSAARTRHGRQLIDSLAADERQLVDMQRRQQTQVLEEAYRTAQQVRQSAENQLLAAYARQYGTANGFADALKNPPSAAEKPAQ